MNEMNDLQPNLKVFPKKQSSLLSNFDLNKKNMLFSRLRHPLLVNQNPGRNILRLSNVLPNFPFTASETKHNYLVKNMYELSHELSNDLRHDLRILGNQEISGKSQNFKELLPSAHSFPENKSFARYRKKLFKNRH